MEQGIELVAVLTNKEENENGVFSEADSESELIKDEAGLVKSLTVASRIKSKSTSFLKYIITHPTEDSSSNQPDLKKHLSLFSLVAYIVGTIIGSGIFITPKSILCRTGSFGLSLIVWTLGGMVAMAGGICYVELGLLLKKSGGEYSIIKEAYSFKKKHKAFEVLASLLSFLFIWCSTCVVRPSALAIITLTSAQYLIQPFYLNCDNIPEGAVKLVSLALLGESIAVV